jgi:hypothetical protein
MFLVLRIAPGLKKFLISDVPANIFRRAAARSGNAAGIFDAFRWWHFAQDEPVLPVIAKVVLVKNLELRIEPIRKPEVA